MKTYQSFSPRLILFASSLVLLWAGLLLAADGHRHAPEIEVEETGSGFSWFAKSSITVLMTFMVWHTVPHVWEATCHACQLMVQKIRSGLPIANTISTLFAHAIPPFARQAAFPRVGTYIGSINSGVDIVQLEVFSNTSGTIRIAHEKYAIRFEESNPGGAFASGEIHGAHGGKVGTFTLTNNRGLRSNELILQLDFDDSKVETVLQQTS